ncbi:MAG: hypothetical protein LBQ20_11815 [Rhodanobacter sp.]|jgi:hypothetical protein|nr:hypothetical protein [Rhodanobacter sp.]
MSKPRRKPEHISLRDFADQALKHWIEKAEEIPDSAFDVVHEKLRAAGLILALEPVKAMESIIDAVYMLGQKRNAFFSSKVIQSRIEAVMSNAKAYAGSQSGKKARAKWAEYKIQWLAEAEERRAKRTIELFDRRVSLECGNKERTVAEWRRKWDREEKMNK